MQFNLKPKTEEQNIEWIAWSKEIKEVGDHFEIRCDKLIFKEDPARFFVIDEENNVGISAYCTNHPDSKFQNATPHGVRLANAIGRATDLEGEVSAEALTDVVNSSEGIVVHIEKTDKGVLWSITV